MSLTRETFVKNGFLFMEIMYLDMFLEQSKDSIILKYRKTK